MTDAAVIKGCLVSIKNVDTHKCARLTIDVPAELALTVIAAFGWPTMVNPVPVAIARLVQEPSAKPEKERRQWSDMPRSQQAGIACENVDFRAFLAERYGNRQEKTTEETVRWVCDVQSRSQLNYNESAADAWDKLYSAFQRWKAGDRAAA